MPKTNIHTYIDAYVIAVNDFIKLFNYIAKRLLFNCYVVVYKLNKQTKKKTKQKKLTSTPQTDNRLWDTKRERA